MAIAKRLRNAFYALLLAFGILLWAAALLLFANVAENSDDFAQYANWILLINLIGIVVLVSLIATRLVQLIRNYRRHVPGSRLQARMVSLSAILAIIPLVIVYTFSVQFINRGIDEWFNVDVERGMADALELSRQALDVQKRRHLAELERFARILNGTERTALIRTLGQLRRGSEAVELTVFGANNQIVATSSADSDASVPRRPSEEMLFQLRQGYRYVGSELRPDGQIEISAAVSLTAALPRGDTEILRAIFPVEQRFGELAAAVTDSVEQFSELNFLRSALKYAFSSTLSLVLLVAILASVYGALFLARRLVEPIQQLMRGTRAVARGDLDTRLEVPAKDEIGFLVNSFNDMTRRLAKARQEASSSEQRVESERKKLEVILARLSTGVLSLEPDLRIRTANQSASTILGADLETQVGRQLADLAEPGSLLEQFLDVGMVHLRKGETEWRTQILLKDENGRRALICACTELPSDGDQPGGYVFVLDDITALLQAQRDAAWGEVARRLAHEIKNPLTPIQLSAERLRRRYLQKGSSDLDLLDRGTHTIIQQVEAMKEMVNAFSQYAKGPAVEFGRFDLNELIGEVVEMYAHQDIPVVIELDRDAELPPVEADADRMRQVFHNLMRNAIESMGTRPDGKITVSTRLVNTGDVDSVKIEVCDNGGGFPDDLIGRAFDPYVTSKEKGTGLGLAIVKKLVEEHGGSIQASNRAQGGAKISILLPLTGGGGQAGNGMRHENRRERA